MKPCKPIDFKPLDNCSNCFEPTTTIYLDLSKQFAYSDKELKNLIGKVDKTDNGKGVIHYTVELINP